MKTYRKKEYQENSLVLSKMRELKGRTLRSNEVNTILNNLDVIDFFLKHPNMTNAELAQVFSISSSSIDRYLNNKVLIQEFYLPETFDKIVQALRNNYLEGTRKKTNSSLDGETIILVTEYLKREESLSKLAQKHNISKDAVYRRLTSERVPFLVGKEQYYMLKEKLASHNLENKYNSKQSLYIENKEIIDQVNSNPYQLAKQSEIQNRTSIKNYDNPRLSMEEATRFRIEAKVKYYAELFLKSKLSYIDTCFQYDMNPKEMATIFYEILAITNMNYYTLLVNKFPYLREYEEEQIMEHELRK